MHEASRSAGIALLMLILMPLIAPPVAVAQVDQAGDYLANIIRHPLVLPPNPPAVYSSYLNLTDPELSCVLYQSGVTLIVSAGLVDLVITGRIQEFPSPDDAAEAALQDYPGYVTVYGYTINKSSPNVLAELGRLLVEASLYAAVDNRTGVEHRLIEFTRLLERGGLDAIQDSLEIAALNLTVSPLLKLVYSIPLYYCVSPKAPAGVDMIGYSDFLKATEALAASLNTTEANLTDIDVFNVTKSLDLLMVYNFYQNQAYKNLIAEIVYPGWAPLVFELPSCQQVPSNLSSPVWREEWTRLQCMIPWLYTTRISLIAHVGLARWNGQAWMLPTPMDTTIEMYNALNRLRLFSDALFIEMQPTMTVAYNASSGGDIPDLPENVEPIGLEEEARTLEELLNQLGDDIPDPGLNNAITDNAGQPTGDDVVVDLNPRVRKIGVDDLKSLVADILRAREALNTRSQPGYDANAYNATLPGGSPLPVFPSIPFYAFLLPLIVFAAYMSREHLESMGYRIKGMVSSRLGNRVDSEAIACYKALLKKLEARGLYKMPWETPREFLERARRAGLPEELITGLESATRAIEAVLYSRDGMPDPSDIEACWRASRVSLKRGLRV